MASGIYFLLMGAPGGTHTKTRWTADGFVCFIAVQACIQSHVCMYTVHVCLQTRALTYSLKSAKCCK